MLRVHVRGGGWEVGGLHERVGPSRLEEKDRLLRRRRELLQCRQLQMGGRGEVMVVKVHRGERGEGVPPCPPERPHLMALRQAHGMRVVPPHEIVQRRHPIWVVDGRRQRVWVVPSV